MSPSPYLRRFEFRANKYLAAFSIVLAAAAVADLATAPALKAAPVSYAFSPDASAVFPAPGSFTFDAATNTQSFVQIFLTGPLPYSGAYYSIPASMGFDNDTINGDDFWGDTLIVNFDLPLDGGNPDDFISSVIWTPFGFPSEARRATAVAGTAEVVPEPNSIILLGTALGLLLLGHWTARARPSSSPR
jgi:hypothetical protein